MSFWSGFVADSKSAFRSLSPRLKLFLYCIVAAVILFQGIGFLNSLDPIPSWLPFYKILGILIVTVEASLCFLISHLFFKSLGEAEIIKSLIWRCILQITLLIPIVLFFMLMGWSFLRKPIESYFMITTSLELKHTLKFPDVGKEFYLFTEKSTLNPESGLIYVRIRDGFLPLMRDFRTLDGSEIDKQKFPSPYLTRVGDLLIIPGKEGTQNCYDLKEEEFVWHKSERCRQIFEP